MNFLVGLSWIFTAAYNIAAYALCAYSLYVIANRCGVKYPWIAFVPILQYYVIGSLCEEYELLGVRIRRLEWVACGLLFIQTFLPYIPYIGFMPRMTTSLVVFAANILTALIMHKFFYLFSPQNAFIFAFLSLFGRLSLGIILFFVKDKPMQMSAGAYPYPFAKRP